MKPVFAACCRFYNPQPLSGLRPAAITRLHAFARIFRLFPILYFLFLVFPAFPQSPAVKNEPYLIPQIVYVGDRATLAVPLGSVDKSFDGKVIETPESTNDLVIHRITKERRGDHLLLLIEFTAYVPGELEVPEITVPGFSNIANPGRGLKITIASILDPSSLVLASASPPLAVPGTAIIVYGTATGILLIILFAIGLRIFWAKQLDTFRQRLRQRRLIRRMNRFIAKLRKEGDAAAALDRLTLAMRRFLSRFLGENCLAMTASEFLSLSEKLPPAPFDGIFLQNTFRRWDSLRFGGIGAGTAASGMQTSLGGAAGGTAEAGATTNAPTNGMTVILDEAEAFINALRQSLLQPKNENTAIPETRTGIGAESGAAKRNAQAKAETIRADSRAEAGR
jgi:hypothetical protein